jgi:hypothetical protein
MSIISSLIDRIFGKQKDEMVVIAQPQSEGEAQMMKERLERQGVPAMVQNRDAAAAYGSIGLAYFVYVMMQDQDRAREALNPVYPGTIDGGAAPATDFDASGGFDAGAHFEPGNTFDAGGTFDSGGGFDGGGGIGG